MSNEDTELSHLIQKKAAKMLKQMFQPKEKQEDYMVLLRPYLVDRADEVLEAALHQNPPLAKKVMEALARIFKSGELNRPINGGQLLWIFKSIGMDIKIKTSIRIAEDGKLISIAEKLRREEK